MKFAKSAIAGILLLLAASAGAQQFPTVPDHTLIGRFGVGGSSGPSQAIPFANLLANLPGAQPANKVWAGPTSGSAALPAFRSLVSADMSAILSSINTWTGAQSFVPPSGSSTAITTITNGTGSTTGNAQQYYNLFNCNSDNVNTGNSPATSYALCMYVQQAFGGTNTFGGRYGFLSSLFQLAPTAATNAVRFYAAVGGQGQANASDGGALGGGNEKGKTYGSNFICAMLNGATGFEQCSAGYDQVFMQTGSSAKTKAIRQLVYGSTDAVQGATNDAALLITAETGASAGGKNGILFSNAAGANPLATNGTVLAVAGSPTVAHGIDLSGATCSSDCYKSTGFLVNSAGAITSGTNGGAGGSVQLNGATSGAANIVVPAVAGTPNLLLPTLSGTFLTQTPGTPTIASGACGTGTNGTISGSNMSGIVTIGAAATTTCTVSFSATLPAAPGACVIFPGNAAAAAQATTVARVGTPSTAQWVITGTALASTIYSYICL